MAYQIDLYDYQRDDIKYSLAIFPYKIKKIGNNYVIVNWWIDPYISIPASIIGIYETKHEAQKKHYEIGRIVFYDKDRLRDTKAKLKDVDFIIMPYSHDGHVSYASSKI